MNKKRTRFSLNQIIEIKKLYKFGVNQYRIAEIFNCNQSSISRVITGVVCGPQCTIDRVMDNFHENINPNKNEAIQSKVLRAKRNRLACTKLNWKKVVRIRKLYFSGKLSQKQLSIKYGVHQSTISRIVNAIKWKTLR